MGEVLDIEPQRLRPLIHAQIDQLRDDELEEVHRQLMVMEAKRRLRTMGEEYAEDWRTGHITQEKVDAAIRDHRARHPYRTPGRP